MQIGSNRVGRAPWDGVDPRDIPTVELRKMLAASTNASSPFTVQEAEAVKVELERRSNPDSPITAADISRRGYDSNVPFATSPVPFVGDPNLTAHTGDPAYTDRIVDPSDPAYRSPVDHTVPGVVVGGIPPAPPLYPDTETRDRERIEAVTRAEVAAEADRADAFTPAPVYPEKESDTKTEIRAKAKAKAEADAVRTPDTTRR